MATFSGIKMAFTNEIVLIKTPLVSSDRECIPNWLKESEKSLIYIRGNLGLGLA